MFSVVIEIVFQLARFLLEQPSPEPKVKVMIPMYEPLETSKCEKCGKVIAEPRVTVWIGELSCLKERM